MTRPGRNRFRAVRCACRVVAGEQAAIPAEARELLRAKPGDRLHVIPFA